ncbi:glycerol-3-phosphate acyltransferase [Actinomycetota bacterium]
MPLTEILKIIGLFIFCYLFGGIHFCNIISKSVGKKDLNKIGDKNPGGWNLVFNISKYWGIFGMWLDALKGFLSYFLVLLLTNSEMLALIGGCIAVLGHNYSPYYKFKGGKGIATTLGLFFAVSPWSMIAMGVGFVGGLYIVRNMIWGVFFGIITPMVFLVIFLKSPIYLLLNLLLIIVVPKYINHSISFKENFKFRKEATLKDLFTPKKR